MTTARLRATHAVLVAGLTAGLAACAGAGPTPSAAIAPAVEERTPASTTSPLAPAAPAARPDPYLAMLAALPDRVSRSIGTPGAGRLEGGVRMPASGPDHVTWDPITKARPSRAWRRVGAMLTVRRTLRALHGLRGATPGLPRVLVGDLSRPRGGDFGARYGIIGHRTHQNGRDVDVYFPRRDRRSAVAQAPSLVDQRVAAALVRALLRAGAERVLVGPSIRVSGPRVAVVAGHDDHAHATF